MTVLPRAAFWYGGLLVTCILLSFVPGAIGAQFTPGAWYAELAKPSVTPPGWVFPVAWTTLYTLIGIALFVFLLRATPQDRRGALVLFGVQLVLNAAWSWLFFGVHAIGLAVIDVVALALVIAATIVAFSRDSRLAAALLVPYLAWVCFAAYLTLAIWHAN